MGHVDVKFPQTFPHALFEQTPFLEILAHGRRFSPGTPASSTTKTGCHDMAEILLKVALSTKNQQQQNQITYL
jgi:hypothetical protein